MLRDAGIIHRIMLLKRIYSSRNLMEAHFVRSLLDAQGISASVMGQTLSEIVGAVPSLPSVWINAEDMDRAAGIVAAFEDAPAHQPPFLAGTSWKCPNCQEVLEGQFTACWRCQKPRPADGQPPEPAIPISTDPTLQTDLSCSRCQYNLRGLTPAHRCPECGLPILRSLLDVLRDGMPPNADELERLMLQPFDTAARTVGHPADALITICHAWMRVMQPLDSNEQSPAKPADIAALTCVGLRDDAIACFGGVDAAKAGLRGWGIHGSDQVGKILCGLMDIRLIEPIAWDAVEAFKGLCNLEGLFICRD
jgi:predicted RNA-binding Zn-ribbon protein involved in translation (DUF1610 family)